MLKNPWHCDDAIMVNCYKRILSSKGRIIFTIYLNLLEKSGSIPVVLLFSQHVIVTMWLKDVKKINMSHLFCDLQVI